MFRLGLPTTRLVLWKPRMDTSRERNGPDLHFTDSTEHVQSAIGITDHLNIFAPFFLYEISFHLGEPESKLSPAEDRKRPPSPFELGFYDCK